MKKTIIIGLCMILALALIGTVALARGPGFGRGFGPGFGAGPGSNYPAIPNLTTDQSARLRALDDKYGREIDPIREQLYGKGRELKAEWLQTEPDRGRIETLQGEAVKLRERLRATLAEHRAAVLKILTLEQRTHVPDHGQGRIIFKPAGLGRR